MPVLQDVGADGDAVDDGGHEARVGEDAAPFRERQVRGDGNAGAFLRSGDDPGEKACLRGVDLKIAEPVEAEQVESAVAGVTRGEAVGG